MLVFQLLDNSANKHADWLEQSLTPHSTQYTNTQNNLGFPHALPAAAAQRPPDILAGFKRAYF